MMFAIPAIVVSAGNDRVLEGVLYRLPVELSTPFQMNWYSQQAAVGWTVCPQGYNVFTAVNGHGDKFVFPGITLLDGPKVRKRLYESPISLTKLQVAGLSDLLITETERLQQAKADELNVMVHDLRALSSAIYNSAENARTSFESGNEYIAKDRIETVIATHTMLSIRIDMMDYSVNRAINTDQAMIPVFKKVDKVVRCFRPKATAKRIALDLRGPSRGSTFGPSIFELIPYAIIDNAIKYAPSNSTVAVSVVDGVKDIRVKVSSLGPYIEPNEHKKIFEKGYRGKYAVRTPQPGTGIGLAAARELLHDHFDGSINVSQQAEARPGGPDALFMTEFEIIVPSS